MGLIAKDLPTLIFLLVPGFVTAGIFYTLTAHPKSSEFERLIQSLIFTTIIKALNIILKSLFLLVGRWHSIGRWGTEVELLWSLILAVLLGLVFVGLANTNVFHEWAKRRGLSNRTSYPSEWYAAFLIEKRYVTLHLTDGRRLRGWPTEWPDQPDRGYFVLHEPQWLLDQNVPAPLYQVEKILIPTADVKMVEFLKDDSEVFEDPAEVQRIETLLIDAQKEEDRDGSEIPPTAPQSSGDHGPE